jgi:hypothetical protein
MEIPGVGPLLASAFVATVADPHAFKSGRCLSAWIGLVPKQNSSRGQREARQHLQSRESLPAPAARRRRNGGHPLCQAERNQATMARAVDGTTNDQGGGGCAGQQDRPHGLGIDDRRRALQGAGRRIERDRARDRRRGWKGRTGANAQSRLKPPDQENPLGPCTSSASFRSGPEPREWHYGQRHMKSRAYRSDTWPHQPATAKGSKNPLPTESRPYTKGTSRHLLAAIEVA